MKLKRLPRPERSEPHPASYPMGTRGSSPRVKAAGAWSWLPRRIRPVIRIGSRLL